MKMVDLIREKRDGLPHSEEAIRFLVGGAAAGRIPDYQVAAWLMAVRIQGMTETETRWLTTAMADSGRRLDLRQIPGKKVDKHSTGGVGDKATMVVAPLVAAAGAAVAKLSGRALGHSGGTLDKLEAIPGFKVDLPVDRFIEQVRRIGIAIAGQTSDMVPADRVFYALRDTTATVDSVPLIASSVMSKKLAAGADAIVLDVKCGRGAFVPGVEEGEELARALVDIGEAAGRQTVAYVTNMEQPLGRAVGNALEVAEAIETLDGRGPRDLTMLSLRLGAEMLCLGGICPDLESAEARLQRAIDDGTGLDKLAQMVEAQGGDPKICRDTGLLPRASHREQVRASATGTVTRIDALEIGLCAKALGAGRDRKEEPIDLSVGVVLNHKVGDRVRAGEPLATIHAASPESAGTVATRVAAAFRLGERAGSAPLLLRRVSASGVESL
jgi:pyrimidine-nucleoside phosphorylase